jgi:hypothetical protein
MALTYNLEPIKSPRLVGGLLDLFSRILRIPIIGQIILDFIKRKNKIHQMVEFANRRHPSLGNGTHEELGTSSILSYSRDDSKRERDA